MPPLAPKSWSARDRQAHLQQAKSGIYDLVIIGGGINGAGVAREASLRGLTFCLLDKGDFAWGTSSRSSKLAHGGLRYLSQGDLRLVRESTTERNWLAAHLPHLVQPLGFMICVYEKSRHSPLAIRAVLRLYDLLSDTLSEHKTCGRATFLDPLQVAEREPAVAQFDPELGKLRMAGHYFDTLLDDGRLTLETLKEALAYSRGASVAVNYAKVEELSRDSRGRIRGVRATDLLGEQGLQVQGCIVVCCAGVWTDEVMSLAGPTVPRIYPTKGVHVVVPASRLGNRGAFGIRSVDDGRSFFILRHGELSIIGTTDTDYRKESSDLDAPWCRKEDCDYLFRTVNRLFPRARLTTDDIVGTYAGIRPLLAQQGARHESAVSRRHEILTSPDGVVALAGGKLTTFRLMAEDLVLHLAGQRTLPALRRHGNRRRGLSRIPYRVGMTREQWTRCVKQEGLQATGTAPQRFHLHRQYGSQGLEILETIRDAPERGTPLLEGHPLCEAELAFILQQENAPRLTDILCRRTEAQWTIWHHRQPELAPKVASLMASYYGWTAKRREKEVQSYLDYVGRTIWF